MGINELLVYSDICGITTEGLSLSFIVLLATGFLAGFSHCVGMCGPLVSTFVLQQRMQRNDATTALLTYQFGRLTSYSLLGLVAGAIGSVVRIGVLSQGWQGAMSIAIGILMIGAGINLLGWWPTHLHFVPTRLTRTVTEQMRRLMRLEHPAANFGLGLGNGLLPCGAVYTVLLLAATTGSPLRGGLTMFLFGLGTLPSMIGIGLFAAQASLRARVYLYQGAAVLIVLVGVQLALRGLALKNMVSHLSISGVMLW